MPAEFSIFDLESDLDVEFGEGNFIFKCANDFSQYIEKRSIAESVTCTKLIIDYCEDRDIDESDIAKLLSGSLKQKILLEMQEAGFARKQQTALEFE